MICPLPTIKDIAQELNLDWDTVKTLEKQYMQAQLARVGTPGPKAIGIDEISIRKGHRYAAFFNYSNTRFTYNSRRTRSH